uniref:Uncharacterized protein n=1 Tax=Chromera velia CCMP2878 TaxID=1169474 RepID=A0A0G4HPZ3_9ALVE|eukprot:Cvel_29978.t1-p1 / transcript=Cvel_29978.t1 / gene=Cvel_29978 / organism=Chromera_velia_CCMP2878 / gene_product=Protein TAPT1 homolog, putative / transcript_product=Protein TAPT1 homolog, putative / location=Cvel_scaffold4202:1629-10824(-) / protein_length=1543 / sequence_SO=supercontig / SO=protein_coding / is_pseudo=false
MPPPPHAFGQWPHPFAVLQPSHSRSSSLNDSSFLPPSLFENLNDRHLIGHRQAAGGGGGDGGQRRVMGGEQGRQSVFGPPVENEDDYVRTGGIVSGIGGPRGVGERGLGVSPDSVSGQLQAGGGSFLPQAGADEASLSAVFFPGGGANGAAARLQEHHEQQRLRYGQHFVQEEEGAGMSYGFSPLRGRSSGGTDALAALNSATVIHQRGAGAPSESRTPLSALPGFQWPPANVHGSGGESMRGSQGQSGREHPHHHIHVRGEFDHRQERSRGGVSGLIRLPGPLLLPEAAEGLGAGGSGEMEEGRRSRRAGWLQKSPRRWSDTDLDKEREAAEKWRRSLEEEIATGDVESVSTESGALFSLLLFLWDEFESRRVPFVDGETGGGRSEGGKKGEGEEKNKKEQEKGVMQVEGTGFAVRRGWAGADTAVKGGRQKGTAGDDESRGKGQAGKGKSEGSRGKGKETSGPPTDPRELFQIPKNQLNEMVETPWRVEKLMYLGFFICLDTLLYEFTFMPLQAMFTLFRLLLGFFQIRLLRPSPSVSSTTHRFSSSTYSRSLSRVGFFLGDRQGQSLNKGGETEGDGGERERGTDETESSGGEDNRGEEESCGSDFELFGVNLGAPAIYDTVRFLLLTGSYLIFSQLDVSRVYHYIRGQSLVKLYVVFNMLEIFEKLVRSLGRDLLESLLAETLQWLQTIGERKRAAEKRGEESLRETTRRKSGVSGSNSDADPGGLSSRLLAFPTATLPLSLLRDLSLSFVFSSRGQAGGREGEACAVERDRDGQKEMDRKRAGSSNAVRGSAGGEGGDEGGIAGSWEKAAAAAYVAGRLMVVVLYVCLHSSLHLLRVLALNIAINSSENAMFLIVITNNFAEIKSSVFKKFSQSALFQVQASSDVVERFHLVSDTFIVFLRMSFFKKRSKGSTLSVAGWLVFIFFLEIVVDWWKHIFLVKFNSLPAAVFERYHETLIADILMSRAPPMPASCWVVPPVLSPSRQQQQLQQEEGRTSPLGEGTQEGETSGGCKDADKDVQSGLANAKSSPEGVVMSATKFLSQSAPHPASGEHDSTTDRAAEHIDGKSCRRGDATKAAAGRKVEGTSAAVNVNSAECVGEEHIRIHAHASAECNSSQETVEREHRETGESFPKQHLEAGREAGGQEQKQGDAEIPNVTLSSPNSLQPRSTIDKEKELERRGSTEREHENSDGTGKTGDADDEGDCRQKQETALACSSTHAGGLSPELVRPPAAAENGAGPHSMSVHTATASDGGMQSPPMAPEGPSHTSVSLREVSTDSAGPPAAPVDAFSSPPTAPYPLLCTPDIAPHGTPDGASASLWSPSTAPALPDREQGQSHAGDSSSAEKHSTGHRGSVGGDREQTRRFSDVGLNGGKERGDAEVPGMSRRRERIEAVGFGFGMPGSVPGSRRYLWAPSGRERERERERDAAERHRFSLLRKAINERVGHKVVCRGAVAFSHAPARRLGFVALPLATLLLSSAPTFSMRSPLAMLALVLIVLCLFLLKAVVSVVLVAYGISRRRRIFKLEGKKPGEFAGLGSL